MVRMNDELVSVRYMVDDVEEAVAFYTTHFGFTVRTSFRSSVRRRRARQLTAAAERPRELGRAADAGRPYTGAGRLESNPLHRR